jgi:hypothetical protein
VSILIDDREDTALATHLERFGLPVMTTRLEFGDIALQTCDGRLIGYERKRISDLINSMKDRRLAGHQLKGMFGLYDRVELIVESVWRPADGDGIEVPSGRNGGWQPLYHLRSGISYRQVDAFLYSTYECGGVAVWRTGSASETAHMLASRWHWWQKPYHLHRAHDTLFTNAPAAQRRGAVTLHQGDPNAVTLIAAQIPGLDAKSWDVGKWFKSPYEMIAADVNEWRKVEWTDRSGNVKHFGKETARQIVGWLRGLQMT